MRVQRIHTLNQRSLFQIACPSGGEKKVLLSLGFINMDQMGSKSKKQKNAKQSLKEMIFCNSNVDLKETKQRKEKQYMIIISKQGYLRTYTNQVPERRELFKLDEQSTVL